VRDGGWNGFKIHDRSIPCNCRQPLRSDRAALMRQHLTILEQRIGWTPLRRHTDKAVLSAMARWFCWRGDGTHVRFTVAQLAVRSGIPQRSVERALERLEADWWIEVTARTPGSRQPTTYRIVIERLATTDPDALTPARVADDEADHPPEWRTNGSITRHNGGRETNGDTETLKDFEKVADLSTGEEVRTDPCTPDPRTLVRQSGGRPEHPDVAAFLSWAIATYPEHAHGARLVLDRERDGHLVHGLLEHYPLARLQAMTVTCWTLEADRDPASHASWIARSDRSLRVLRHKAAFLERVVVGAQQLTFGALEPMTFSYQEIKDAERRLVYVYGRCPHEPPCAKTRDCVREIARARRAG
jgi:hypothetical protein